MIGIVCDFNLCHHYTMEAYYNTNYTFRKECMKVGKLKIGIIGCGGIANGKHLPALATQNHRAEIVGFCDTKPERAQEAAKQYGTFDAKICTDYRKLVENSAIDIIHVCTPNVSHCEITVAALEAGKHVMCEKPMAATAADARKMLDASKRTSKLLTIGYQYRNRNDSLAMKERCEDGGLGEIYYAKCHALRRRFVPTWGVFTDKSQQGGGPLLDIGTHSLDLALWMMDNYKPKTAMGTTYNKLATTLMPGEQGNLVAPWNPETYDLEDSAFGFITMENGATLTLEASWLINMDDVREGMVTLCGTRAGATMRKGERNKHRMVLNKVVHDRLTTEEPDLNIPFNVGPVSVGLQGLGPDERECVRWLDAVEGKGELFVKPEQALVVSQILEALYISAQTGELYRF